MAFGRRHIVECDLARAAARHFAAALACLLAAAVPAPAQHAPNSPVTAPQAQAPPAEAPPADRPGFLDALGRFFGSSQEALGSGLKNTQDALGTLGAAIPAPRIVTGRQACPLSSNGAPDCQQGVEAFCKQKGLQGGKVLEVASAHHCSARFWAESGFKRKGICRVETYVTRAVCH